jgi:hypothetical protein
MNAHAKISTSVDVAQLANVLRSMARSWANSWKLYPHLELPDCVDNLQDYAVRTGLLDAIGQNAVQAIMDEEFRLVRAAVAATGRGATPPDDNMEEMVGKLSRPYTTAQSTVDAFWYLFRQGDNARMKHWLAEHPYDGAYLLGLLRGQHG